MLKDFKIKEGLVYIGRNAGKYILSDIKNAKQSVKIVTPYVSSRMIEHLVQLIHDDIDVSLILSSEIGGAYYNKNGIIDKIASLRMLVSQRRVDSQKLRKKKTYYLAVTHIFFLLLISFCILGSQSTEMTLYSTCIVGVFYKLFWNRVKRKKTYHFEYFETFKFKVLKKSNFLLHSKMYIIDEKIAYLGSLNFTQAGFFDNYESRIKISDDTDIYRLHQEFQYLWTSNTLSRVSLSELIEQAAYLED